MAIRKEQVLAIATLVVAGLVVPKYLAAPAVAAPVRITPEDYAPTPLRGYTLADANAPKASRRDPFVECRGIHAQHDFQHGQHAKGDPHLRVE